MNKENLNLELENLEPERAPETDSNNIIRRHIENEEDQITDEDIRNIDLGSKETEIKSDAANFLKETNHTASLDEENKDEHERNNEPSADHSIIPWDVKE